MTEPSSNHAESTSKRTALCWLLFPLAHFPLLALLTYDWRSISDLNLPALASTNWIGALGDYFSFYGYQLFGLAIWIVPFLCLVAVWSWAGRRTLCFGWRKLWLPALLVSVSCLLQVLGSKVIFTASAMRSINISDAGGAIGYLLMTRLLSPLLNDFGSAVIMVILLIVSLIGLIGLQALSDRFSAILRWALASSPALPRSDASAEEELASSAEDAYQAALEARAAAKRQREAEKAAIKAQKLAEKEARRQAREARQFPAEPVSPTVPSTAPTPSVAPTPTPAQIKTPTKASVSSRDVAESDSPEDKGPYLLPPHNLLNPLSKSAADHGNAARISCFCHTRHIRPRSPLNDEGARPPHHGFA